MTQGRVRECDGYVMDLSDSISVGGGVLLYRIYSTKPRLGGLIPMGARGGYIASPDNLSGTAWVDETSTIFNFDARVADNACVMNGSQILASAKVENDAVVRDHSLVGDYALVGESAVIRHSLVTGHSAVFGSACVYDSRLEDESTVSSGVIIVCSHLAGTALANQNASVLNCNALSGEFFTGNMISRGTRKGGN